MIIKAKIMCFFYKGFICKQPEILLLIALALSFKTIVFVCLGRDKQPLLHIAVVLIVLFVYLIYAYAYKKKTKIKRLNPFFIQVKYPHSFNNYFICQNIDKEYNDLLTCEAIKDEIKSKKNILMLINNLVPNNKYVIFTHESIFKIIKIKLDEEEVTLKMYYGSRNLKKEYKNLYFWKCKYCPDSNKGKPCKVYKDKSKMKKRYNIVVINKHTP